MGNACQTRDKEDIQEERYDDPLQLQIRQMENSWLAEKASLQHSCSVQGMPLQTEREQVISEFFETELVYVQVLLLPNRAGH